MDRMQIATAVESGHILEATSGANQVKCVERKSLSLKSIGHFIIASFVVLLAGTSMAQTEEQDLRRMATEMPEIMFQLTDNDWQLVGQAIRKRDSETGAMEVSTMSLAYEKQGDQEFLESLNLPDQAEVYYDLTRVLRLPELNRHLEVPRRIEFAEDERTLIVGEGDKTHAMSYRLEFPIDQPEPYLFLETVIEEERSLIHGNLRFVGDQLQMVQSTTNMEIVWIYRVIENPEY